MEEKWKIYQAQTKYLDFLIDLNFQEVNRFFVLSFTDENGQKSYQQYYFSTVEIKDYNLMIDGRNLFDKAIKSNLRTYDNSWKIAIGQGDDHTTGCLLDYRYFREFYKLIARGLIKQQKLDADPKTIQQINFTGNLYRAEGAMMT